MQIQVVSISGPGLRYLYVLPTRTVELMAMGRSNTSTSPVSEAWKIALLAGVVSGALSFGYNHVYHIEDVYTLNMLIVGGFLAGLIAQQQSLRATEIGFRAGIFGGVPAFLWVFPTLTNSAFSLSPNWLDPAGGVFIAFGFSLLVFFMAGLAGAAGGAIGGWTMRRVDGLASNPV